MMFRDKPGFAKEHTEKRLKEKQANYPIELFDGYKVYNELSEPNKELISPLQVSDVLDAIVKLIKKRIGN